MGADFTTDGNLPPGVHEYTWDEFVTQFGWNERRRQLLAGLKAALTALKVAGCPRAFIDGSFVTRKEEPGDFDACWEVTGVDPGRLDRVLLTFDPGRMAQKLKYGGELFPAEAVAEAVSGQTYLEFFQNVKDTGGRKGIATIDLRRLP